MMLVAEMVREDLKMIDEPGRDASGPSIEALDA